MGAKKLIEGLNEALNREVSTFLRYMVQGAMIRGAKWEGVRKMYLSEVQDEVGHAQYLASAIVNLGGTPKLAPDLTPPPEEVTQMLQRDAEQEQIDVQHYLKLADLAGEAGQIALKLKMEDQAADEQEHRTEMLRLLA